MEKTYAETTIGESESGLVTVYGRNPGEIWTIICRTMSKSEAIDIAMDWGVDFVSPKKGQIRIGEHYEYDLNGDSHLTGNKPGVQEFRIANVSHRGVEVEYKVMNGGITDWVRSKPIGMDAIDYMFAHRGLRLVAADTKAVEVLALEREMKETPLCDKEVLVECIKSGSHFTSQLAKCLGKPVAATNSILNSLRNKGFLKVTKETEGLKWEIA